MRKDVDMETTPTKLLDGDSADLDSSMAKVLKNHRGHLESCIIHHNVSHRLDEALERLIHTVTRVKNTKDLTLVNHLGTVSRVKNTKDLRLVNRLGSAGRWHGFNTLYMVSDSFSHHSLTSLTLFGFRLISAHLFTNCLNLKTLKLVNITNTQAGVLSRVFAACSSLEVIVLGINSLTRHGVLRIENNSLKFLQVASNYKLDRLEVYATCLDVLDVAFIKCERDNFILTAPPNVRFNRNYWVSRGFPHPHLSYNISYLAQEKKSNWHELMVSNFYVKCRDGSLSVSLDLTNSEEVEILKELLLMWTTEEMKELEILFKTSNAPREEGECSTSTHGRADKRLWEDTKPFPNADFRVHNVWMYNFNGLNKEEFALASHFVMQKTVIEKMMIETSSFPPMKKSQVEAAVAKLMELPKGNQDFSIECF